MCGLLNLYKALGIAGSAMIITTGFPNIIIRLLTNISNEEFNIVFRQKRTEELIGTITELAEKTGSSVIWLRLTTIQNVYNEVKELLATGCDVYTCLCGTPE